MGKGARRGGFHSLSSNEPGLDLGPKLSKWELLKFLRPYFLPGGRPERIRVLITWAFLICSKVCTILAPPYIGKAADAISGLHGPAYFPVHFILMYCGLGLASKAFKEAQNFMYLRVKQAAYQEIATATFGHLHSLSLNWHLTKKTGQVLRSMDRGIASANTVVTYLFMSLGPTLIEAAIFCLIFLVKYRTGLLALIAFSSIVLYAAVTFVITNWRKKIRAKANSADNSANDKAVDSFTNFETVKYFTNEQYERARYGQSVADYQAANVATMGSLNLLNTTQQVIIRATLAAGLLVTAHRVVAGELTVGDFMAVSVYIAQLFTPLSFLGTIYNVIVQAFVDMENLAQLLAQSPDVQDMPGAAPLSAARGTHAFKADARAKAVKAAAAAGGGSGVSGAAVVDAGAIEMEPLAAADAAAAAAGDTSDARTDVEFRAVCFNYPSQPVENGLKEVSFTVPAGTTTAIVGHTGAGKSTISRLLFRFYDIRSGEVLVGGQDVSSVTQHSLRCAIGIVPQDTVLFNDTIAYNIGYGRIGSSEEEIVAAAKAAQIHEFIQSLPEGYDAMVGERGLKLSGGEKQRVAIARTILKDPPILVLDEATSALDTNTEHEIQASLSGLRQGRTTLVIAHRLSTIRDADQILVMHGGRVVERGTHDQLMANAGMLPPAAYGSDEEGEEGEEGDGGGEIEIVLEGGSGGGDEDAASSSSFQRPGLYARLWRKQVESNKALMEGGSGGGAAEGAGGEEGEAGGAAESKQQLV